MKKNPFLFLVFCLFICGVNVYAQDSKPFAIIERPTPAPPDSVGNFDVVGTVRLRVEFLSTGEIGEITTVAALTPVLTARATEAAKKIKFTPEIKNGVPVTVNRVIEYEYKYGWVNYVAPVTLSNPKGDQTEKAEAIVKRAIEKVGGEKYLQVRTIYGKGAFSQFKDGMAVGYSSFIDIIVFPDKERTEFKTGGYKNVQTNDGGGGWIYGEDTRSIVNQTPQQIEDFKRSLRVSLDNILRGAWRAEGAKLSYVGRREASLGHRNEVVKLTYSEDFWVEFEFGATDGLPAKAVYQRKNSEGEVQKEEDRYAQFVDIQGVLAPFIIDHFRDGKQTSRINYQSLEYNKSIPPNAFTKPADLKEAKKELKL
jgi:hypothetical protein